MALAAPVGNGPRSSACHRVAGPFSEWRTHGVVCHRTSGSPYLFKHDPNKMNTSQDTSKNDRSTRVTSLERPGTRHMRAQRSDIMGDPAVHPCWVPSVGRTWLHRPGAGAV